METTELWKAPGLVPSLAYKDVPTAVQWLGRVFGFRERTQARLSGTGGCRTWMELGDVLISLTTEGGHELRSPESVGGVSVGLKVYRRRLPGPLFLPSQRTVFGAGGFTERETSEGITGSSRSVARILPRRIGDFPQA
jgi:hypothetical protein